ncbi:MAG: M23 family metallopeptidase [Bacteroidia bacterium]|nr:M23 family metallopeptidase [Bacteroidia bacterium]MDW8057955.1 M23 family metallopeptidase [Bacteroidia bacterium]
MQRFIWLSSLLPLLTWAHDSLRVKSSPDKTLYQELEGLSQHLPRVWWDRQWVSACRPRDIRSIIAPVRILLEDPERNFYFVMPVRGRVVSGFGFRWGWQFHYGLDVDLRIGDTVVAAMDGEVRLAGYDPGGYGYYCVIAHPNGLETVYGHFSRLLVTREQFVKAGDPVGLGGSTGYSTGPHLHFEVRFMGEPVDVSKLLDFENGVLLERELHISSETFAHLASVPKQANMRGGVYHVVRPGESLYSISRRYGVSVRYLAAINRLSTRSTLRVGQRLRVR